jgi:hypothetical protein
MSGERLVIESSRAENLPVVRRHDADGRAVEGAFRPAYHHIGRSSRARGVFSTVGAPGNEAVIVALAYPAVHEILARMNLRTMTGSATTFQILAMTDRLDSADPLDIERLASLNCVLAATLSCELPTDQGREMRVTSSLYVPSSRPRIERPGRLVTARLGRSD